MFLVHDGFYISIALESVDVVTFKEKLWKAITSDAAEKRKQDDLEKAA